MPDDHVLAARVDQHQSGNFAGKRAFALPVHVLCGNSDGRALRRFHRRGNRRKGRCDHNVAMLRARHQRPKRLKKCARVPTRFIHLPVPCDHRPPLRFAHGYAPFAAAFVSASTPGSFSPARNSSDAPPPVEMCEICFATPDSSTAATESPPPTIDVAPPAVAAATAFAMPNVPCANGGRSNIPIGPFHTIVLAAAISRPKSSTLF